MRLVALALALVACNPPSHEPDPANDAAATEPVPGVVRVLSQQQKLLPPAAPAAIFGQAIGLGGDRMAIGAPGDSQAGPEGAGAVYVFAKSGVTWNLEQQLFASDPTAGQRIGKSVDISGNTVIVGGTGFGAGGARDGAVYVFTRTGTTWSEQQKITVADATPSARFGQTVRIEGETAVIGTPNDGTKGSVYVFTRSGTVWSQQQKLTAPDAAAGDRFGYFVEISGNSVIIGARNATSNRGAAYVFVRSGVTWLLQQKLTASDAADGDQFGRAVDINGNTAVVGAWVKNSGRGAAYVFTRNGVTWTQQQKLTASDGATGDEYGSAVSLVGETAVIGSKKDDDNGNDSGALYVYKRTGVTWIEDQKVKPTDEIQTDDRFAQAIAFNGVTLVGGAYVDDEIAADAGAAYI
nr:FG-GAP repeat protein [Deltaproteobacteria bacterium]